MNKTKKILIFGPSWIGDTIMSTPMVRAIKSALPSSRIFLVVIPYVYPLWKRNHFVDEIMIFKASRMAYIFSYLKLLWWIKKNRFDLAIILPHHFRYALAAFLAGIPCRVGYNVRNRGLFLTHPLAYNINLRKSPMVENYMDILRKIGIKSEAKDLVLNIGLEAKIKAKEILEKNAIKTADLAIGIAPGAIHGPAKRWPIERYAELTQCLIKKYNAKALVFIGPAEKALGYRMSDLTHNKPIIFNGSSSLLETAALIKRCNIFITNDSGLMHIAAAVGTKAIAIFGSTSPEWTGPYGKGHIVIKKPTDCSPCFKRKCSYDTYKCLNSIIVNDVLKVIDENLRSNINL